MGFNDENKLAVGAIIALTVISLAGLVFGAVVAWHGSPVQALAPIITGAIAGIVAIVLRDVQKKQ